MRDTVYKKFTLIELIVILTIIMILSSLLVPASQIVFEKQDEISCASKLGILGAATHLYLNDNNASFWNYQDKRRDIGRVSGYWPEFIDDQYTGDKYGRGEDNSWGSPGKPIPDTVYFCLSNPMDISNNNPMNYVINYYLLDLTGNRWHSQKGFKNINRITVPSQVSLFTEGNYVDPSSRMSAYYMGSESFRNTRLFTPHYGKTSANTVYVDGRVSLQERVLENDQIGCADRDPEYW